MQTRHRDRSRIRQSLQRHRRLPDRAGPLRGSDSLAGTRHGSAPLRTTTLSALQPGPRVSRKRDVQPRDALLPGSAGNRAALFAGEAGARLASPHGELKTRSHLIKARTPWKGRHLQDETVETQPNHHFPPDSITAGLWFPCHKTIYEISSSQALELPCKAGASALCLARLQPSIQAVFLATTDRWHNRNFCSGRNSRGKSTGVTHILVGHKNIHVPSSFARLG